MMGTMGTDIHAFAEFEPLPGLREVSWVCLSEVCIWPDDTLFALLANVRNDERESPLTPIALPRGLPHDCSWEVKAQARRWAGYDHSNLMYDELVRVQDAYSQIEEEIWELQWLSPRSPLHNDRETFEGTQVAQAAVNNHFRSIPERPSRDQDSMMLVEYRRRGVLGPNKHLAAILAYLQVYQQKGLQTRMVFFFEGPELG